MRVIKGIYEGNKRDLLVIRRIGERNKGDKWGR